MRGEGLINTCQAAVHGHRRYVRHADSGKGGLIVRCSGDRLEVETEEGRQSWRCEECEEYVPEDLPRPV